MHIWLQCTALAIQLLLKVWVVSAVTDDVGYGLVDLVVHHPGFQAAHSDVVTCIVESATTVEFPMCSNRPILAVLTNFTITAAFHCDWVWFSFLLYCGWIFYGTTFTPLHRTSKPVRKVTLLLLPARTQWRWWGTHLLATISLRVFSSPAASCPSYIPMTIRAWPPGGGTWHVLRSWTHLAAVSAHLEKRLVGALSPIQTVQMAQGKKNGCSCRGKVCHFLGCTHL